MNRILNDFQRGYVICALWSSNDNSNDQGGDPLDKNYSIHHISDESLAKMKEDCDNFSEENKDNLSESISSYQGRCASYDEGSAEDWQGHDFWLSRNGHGAGFFDRGLGAIGDKLQDAAKAFGECYLYVGDDAKIYCS